MRLERMRPLEVQQYFEQNTAVVIPVGSIECHGTHNALGVDTLAVNKLADMIDEKSKVLIATPIPYGACDTLSDYPGTISIGHELLYKLVSRITQELAKHGARRFIFLNGHGGNTAALSQVCFDLHSEGRLGALINWWTMAWELNADWKGGHGGAQETSAMLAIDPTLVRMDLIEDEHLVNDIKGFETTGFSTIAHKGINIYAPRSVAAFTHNGWIGTDHPKNATEKWGKEMLAACADYICDFIETFDK